MKIGVGLLINRLNLPLLGRLPIDFVVPYCWEPAVAVEAIRESYPTLDIKGETLLSPHHFNNRYLGKKYAHLLTLTRIETERFILNDILGKVERYSPHIHQWELFNELFLDDGRSRKCKKCEFWDSEFYGKVVKEIRLISDCTLLYSDYNFKSPEKYRAIAQFIDQFQLDGVCIQLHLAIASLQWAYLSRRIFADTIHYFKRASKKVVISEVGIRQLAPSTFALSNHIIRDKNLIKDTLKYRGMGILPQALREAIALELWRYLIERCESLGVDEFYCFKTDANFDRDNPSLVSQDFKWKLDQ